MRCWTTCFAAAHRALSVLLRRDTRWHGGSDSNQQDKAEVEPDWSPEAERRRWDELQEAFQARRERGFGAGGVSMFMALVEDGGCKSSRSLCVFIDASIQKLFQATKSSRARTASGARTASTTCSGGSTACPATRRWRMRWPSGCGRGRP